MTTTETVLAGQAPCGTQSSGVGEDPNSVTTQPCRAGGDGPHPRDAQIPADTHGVTAQTPEPTTADSISMIDASTRALTSPAATLVAEPNHEPSPGSPDNAAGQGEPAIQRGPAGGAQSCPPGPVTDRAVPEQNPLVLVDDTLAVLANAVGDLENFRKACASQLEVLTRVGADKDGKHRGWGLPKDHPAVLQQATIVAQLKETEKAPIRALEKHLKRSPLGPWVFGQKGLGYKSIARLLAATGDPYWNSLHDRPRLVSELWSYCGYGDPAGQGKVKGQRVGYNPEAKMRAFNCIQPTIKTIREPCESLQDESGHHIGGVHVAGCSCSPWRVLYDQEKARYVGSLHERECTRCTAKGQPPAPVGSPRKPAHVNGCAVRNTTKELLRQLWAEARRLHELPDGHMFGADQ